MFIFLIIASASRLWVGQEVRDRDVGRVEKHMCVLPFLEWG